MLAISISWNGDWRSIPSGKIRTADRRRRADYTRNDAQTVSKASRSRAN
jgi:hypothetical protein